MADTSPGKVQALLSFFSEKEVPVMGMLQPGNRSVSSDAAKTWKKVNSLALADNEEESIAHTSVVASPDFAAAAGKLKVLPSAMLRTTLTHPRNTTSAEMIKSSKPEIAKKPLLLMKSPIPFASNTAVNQNRSTVCSEDQLDSRVCNLSKKEDIVERHSEVLNAKANENIIEADQRIFAPTLQKTEFLKLEVQSTNNSPSCTLQLSNISSIYLENCSELMNSSEEENSSCLVTSEILRNKINLKRKSLPSKDKLGPPPLKPSKPPVIHIPTDLTDVFLSLSDEPAKCYLFETAPPVPAKVAPIPPSSSPVPSPSTISPKLSSVLCTKNVEISSDEELYGDTLVKDHTRPVSLIPEYTEEEELGIKNDDVLYDDTGIQALQCFAIPRSEKPKNPPPPPPSPSSTSKGQQCNYNEMEELYQDANTDNMGEFYEEMPSGIQIEEESVPLYGNTKREEEKLQKEEKKLRKEQKEKEKKAREIEKLNRKFGLTGEEVPIDTWLVKADTRGGRHDLQVRKGEIVHILRMENNPSGKWLVKNESGKIGYVELSNIEVDADSVKSVMSDRRVSQQIGSSDDPIYSDTRLNEEDIYEVTF